MCFSNRAWCSAAVSLVFSAAFILLAPAQPALAQNATASAAQKTSRAVDDSLYEDGKLGTLNVPRASE